MRKIKIAIIGSGVIGEAAGRGFLDYDQEVIFCDVNEDKLQSFRNENLNAIHADDLHSCDADVFLISIQTPTIDNEVNLSPLKKALIKVGEAVKNHSGFPVVATRSTVPPGTAKEVVVPILEDVSGKKAGKDFGVGSNPEFLRELTAYEDFINPRLVVIGSEDRRTRDVLVEIYKPFGVPIHELSTHEAEMQKYVHNLFNAAKISFFNEQRKVCESMGISADAIFPVVVNSAEASWNPKYGTKNLGPYSGACLPKDVKGFLNYAKNKLGIDLKLLQSVEDVNEQIKKDSE